jgi:hypothetical protein
MMRVMMSEKLGGLLNLRNYEQTVGFMKKTAS